MFRRDLKHGKARRNRRSDSARSGDAASGERPNGEGTVRWARNGTAQGNGSFVLYVEGPRDLEILGYWAKRIDPCLARCIEAETVILGGKRPARAISDFSKRGGQEAGISGLIVLDRDDHDRSDHDEARVAAREVGLEVFVWSLRHIESYLLVPDVIRRVLDLDLKDRRVEDLIRLHESAEAVRPLARSSSRPSSRSPALPPALPPSLPSSLPPSAIHPRAEEEGGGVHAKRILGANGALAELLGAEVSAGRIARAMRREDLHEDVFSLMEKVRELSGLGERGPEVEVIVRRGPSA